MPTLHPKEVQNVPLLSNRFLKAIYIPINNSTKNVKLWNNLEQCGLTVKDKGLARYCHFCNFVTAMLIETFKNKGQKVRTQKKGIHTSLYPNPECLHKPKFFLPSTLLLLLTYIFWLKVEVKDHSFIQ